MNLSNLQRHKTELKGADIGEIPDDWNIVTIDSIKSKNNNSIAMGPFGSNITKDNFIDKGVPVIRGGNIEEFRFKESNFVYVSEEKADELKASNAYPKDIVITHRGTLGQVGIIPEDSKYPRYVVSQSQMKLTCDENIVNPLFVYYFLKSKRGQYLLLRNKSQTGVPAIARPTTSLKEIKIPIPKLIEQNSIVDLLKSLDDKIELNRQMNSTLEQIAQTLFKRWFIDFEFPDENGNPYRSSGGRMVDSEFGEIPERWKVKRLEDIATINENSIKKDYPHEEILYVDISSVDNGKLVETTKYDIKKAPSRAKRIVKKGDIIWSTVRPNRRSFLLILDPEKNLVVSTGFAVISPKVLPYPYMYLWLTTDSFVSYLSLSADGSAYPAVTAERFKEAKVLAPEQKILKEFERITSFLLIKIDLNSKESSKLSQVRDSLLPKLMSGEIRVEC